MKRIIRILAVTLLVMLTFTVGALCDDAPPPTENMPEVTFTCEVTKSGITAVVPVTVTTSGLVPGEGYGDYRPEINARFLESSTSIALTGDDVNGYTLTLNEFSLGENDGGLTIDGNATIKLVSSSAIHSDITITGCSLTGGALTVDGDLTISGGRVWLYTSSDENHTYYPLTVTGNVIISGGEIWAGSISAASATISGGEILADSISAASFTTHRPCSTPFTVPAVGFEEGFRVYADGVTDGITYFAGVKFYLAERLFEIIEDGEVTDYKESVTLTFQEP